MALLLCRLLKLSLTAMIHECIQSSQIEISAYEYVSQGWGNKGQMPIIGYTLAGGVTILNQTEIRQTDQFPLPHEI